MNTWTFVKLVREEISQTPPNKPIVYYSWELRKNNERPIIGSSMKEHEALSLKQFYNVDHDYQMVGMSFKSKEDNPFTALEIFILKSKNKGHYRKPNPTTIVNKFIKAMINMEEPDFSNIDKWTVYETFRNLWGDGVQPNPEWIKSIKERVVKESKSEVTVKETKKTKDKKLPNVLGPSYFLDITDSSGHEITAMIGPYENPLVIVANNRVKK